MSMRYNQVIFLSVLALVLFSSALSLEAKLERHNTVSAVSDSKDSCKNNSSSRFDSIMQSPFAGRNLSPREQIEIAVYIQVQDSIYREKFKMGFNEFNHAMRLGYDDFINKAFNDLKLSDQTIKELWQEYLDHSWWKRPSKVEKYSNVVQEKIKERNKLQKAKQKAEQEALDSKNKAAAMQQEAARKKAAELRLLAEQNAYEKQRAIEEQKKLAHALFEKEAKEQQEALIFYEQMVKNQYQACDFDLANCLEPELEKQWRNRQEALSTTTQQDFMQFDQAHHLTPQTVGFLAAHDIDYKDYQGFFGTDLQQQLHGEMCDALSQAATVQSNFPYQSNLQTSVVEFADAAYDANKNHQVLLASRLMDVDWIVLKLSREIATAAIPYAKSVASGVVHSATDFLHMAAHPIETCKGLGRALCFVLETTALNCSEVVLQYPEIYEPMRDKRNAEISQALRNLGNQMAESTGPQRVEAITRFGADFIVPGKIIRAVGGVCGAVRSQAKIMRTIEGVALALGDELGFEEISQELILATEQLEVAAQENIANNLVAELMEAEKVIEKATRIISESKSAPSLPVRCKLLSFQDSFDQLKKFGYKISVNKSDLFNNIDYYLKQACAKVNTKIEAALLDEYKTMQQIAGNAEMSVCMDLEHTVNIKYKLILDESKSFYTVDLKGGHLAGTMTKLEQEGLVAIESFLEFGNGCVEYKMKDLCTGGKFTHTEFPPHWNAEKIAQETKVACENAMRNGLLTPEAKKPLKVTTSDGFALQIITNTNPSNHTCAAIENTLNRHVVTAYPIYMVKK